MGRIIGLAQAIFRLITRGGLRSLVREFLRRFYSDERALCLRRDLHVPFETPVAKLPLTIRPLANKDIEALLEGVDDNAPAEGARERAKRKLFLREQVPTCYVATTEEDEPTYMQWLMSAEQNDKIQSYFKGGFPVLKKDEALLEFAFSLERYRGMRIMPHAMAEIAKKGEAFGARYIITFVNEDNTPSLKGCKRSGFTPYMIRDDRRRFFRRRSEFTMLPENTPYSFDVK